ncbi:MAG: DHH family phosphoesterase [Lachnospiraceae bacterium]
MSSIQEMVLGAKSIGIGGHVRPDGDCIGASMALYLYLKKLNKELDVQVFLEEPSEIFKCIDQFDCINTKVEEKELDVFFALDCTPDYMGEFEVLYRNAKKKINIDHHITNMGHGDISFVENFASSTCEVLYGLLDPMYLDVEIAKSLYIGIMHDTGIFQYSNTSKRTFQILGELVSFGFDFPKLITETFYQKTYNQNQILGRALLESIRFMDGLCVATVIDKKMMEFYEVESKDLSGIVNQLRIIEGVDCAILMYQVGVQEYKVSLRSNDVINVSKIAALFGGGGHVRAAGFVFKGTPHDVINNVSAQITLQLKEL